MTLSSIRFFQDALRAAKPADPVAISAAQNRNAQLTKPAGSLGRLEDVALWLAGWQKTEKPRVQAPQVAIFAGNHGVTAKGVSAFPSEVTYQMVLNFQSGGAAINQLCRSAGARLDVVALDLDRPTQDFTEDAAMTETDLLAALATGWDAVDPASDLFVTGEMGIGNTTSAAAIAAALFGGDPASWVGRGTGVDDAGIARKVAAVTAGLVRHQGHFSDPLQVLRCLGGREIAAMVGAIARARVEGIPTLLDGFIASAAGAVLHKMAASNLDHAMASHQSAEAGHVRILKELGKEPLLQLGLRLGEGSGAALAIHIVKAAAECHSGMATFAEAGVSAG